VRRFVRDSRRRKAACCLPNPTEKFDIYEKNFHVKACRMALVISSPLEIGTNFRTWFSGMLKNSTSGVLASFRPSTFLHGKRACLGRRGLGG